LKIIVGWKLRHGVKKLLEAEMTWLEWMKKIDPKITAQKCHDILMEQTAYPFAKPAFIKKQVRKILKRKIKNENISMV
jgi:hypothetical protein